MKYGDAVTTKHWERAACRDRARRGYKIETLPEHKCTVSSATRKHGRYVRRSLVAEAQRLWSTEM